MLLYLTIHSTILRTGERTDVDVSAFVMSLLYESCFVYMSHVYMSHERTDVDVSAFDW